MADERFRQAERFVAAVQSRLAKDAVSVPPRLWAFQPPQPAARRLWALRQQALVGSCDAARAAGDYPRAAGGGDGPCVSPWAEGCCLAVARGDSSLKLWQALGDLPPEDAQTQFVRLLDELLPEWADPQPPDAALLRTWTPDDDSDECAACGEAFTLLNRRHHCRRCLRLVCAVCSPHSLPLRVFSQQTARRQRLCVSCYAQVAAGRTSSAGARTRSRSRVPSADSDAASSASSRSLRSTASSSGSLRSTASSSSLSSSAPPPAPLAAVPPSAAIHTGPLELLHGAGGFRKAWRPFFFVLLVRKGSLGMFPAPPARADAGRQRPAAVFKLSGYALRLRAHKRRPHQFRLAHATKKPLQLAAAGMDDLRAWLAALMRAVDCANALERGPDADADADRTGSIADRTGSSADRTGFIADRTGFIADADADGADERAFMQDVDAERDA